MKVAIMQPTYLPWIGYFDLIDRVDQFVFLDHVEFNERSWQQRNRIRNANGVQWLTVPVKKSGRSGQPISQVEIVTEGRKFPEKHIKALRFNYGSAEHFEYYFNPLRKQLLEGAELGRLSELNKQLIRWLTSELGIEMTFRQSSEMEVNGQKADLLLDICDKLGAQLYLSPLGSLDYLEDESQRFESNDIDLRFQHFEHPEYEQTFDGFESHLSVVDLLFNEGSNALQILRSGQRSHYCIDEARDVKTDT
jgi:hypothetical protein